MERNGQQQRETDNEHNWTEIDRNRQYPTKRDRNGQEWTETDKTEWKQIEIERNGERGTEKDI